MRKAEILNLTVDKVNLNKRFIDLSLEGTKDYEKCRIYFGNDLSAVSKSAPYVLPWPW